MSTLKINETKITAENAFNPAYLRMEGRHELKKEGKTFFEVILLIHERFLNL